MRFDSFDQVVSWYERTKPLVSVHHTLADDVRPLGNRKRKWERIKKIDDNTYALLDGCYANTMWISDPGTHEFENRMAPIVWTRREDGDFIRITNHRVGSIGPSRYEFLRWHLPRGMRFDSARGKHFVYANGVEYPLPKTETKYDYATKQVTHIDDVYLMFRVNGDGTFTRVGDPVIHTTSVIDREAKKEWQGAMRSFYEYMVAIVPMLDRSWDSQREYRKQLGFYGINYIPADVARSIISDESNEARVALAVLISLRIWSNPRSAVGADELRRIKAAYNRVMNKLLGLYKTMEV